MYDGSKPKLWFTGDKMNDPILLAFETPQKTASGNSLMIYQYANFEMMKVGQREKTLELPRTNNSLNEGSPSFEFVDFSGDITTSSFGLYYEYQESASDHGDVHIGYGEYRFSDPTGDFEWTTHSYSYMVQVFQDYGYQAKLGSRHRFTYRDEEFYLVEAMPIHGMGTPE